MSDSLESTECQRYFTTAAGNNRDPIGTIYFYYSVAVWPDVYLSTAVYSRACVKALPVSAGIGIKTNIGDSSGTRSHNVNISLVFCLVCAEIGAERSGSIGGKEFV